LRVRRKKDREETKADFEKHQAAELRLKELERERSEREKLRDNLAKVESALASFGRSKVFDEALENASRRMRRLAD
jgi:hypothetical protein